MYCDRSNLTAPAGDCAPGYYCTTGVDTATPSGGNTGDGDICPTGHYCPGATVNPIGCEAGSYQDLTNQADCQECPAGYYCVSNSTTYTNQICPSGHFCPNGTEYDIQHKCPIGTFNNITGTVVTMWLLKLDRSIECYSTITDNDAIDSTTMFPYRLIRL